MGTHKFILGQSLLLVFLFLLGTIGFAPAFAETPSTLTPDQKTLEVRQDPLSELFTIRAHEIPRQDILQKISEITGLTVKSLDDELLQDIFNVDIQGMPANQIVNQLLEDLNTVFIYAPAGETTYDSQPRLDKVLIMSRKQGMPVGLKEIQPIVEAAEESGEENRIVMESRLGQAIIGNQHMATRRLLRELMETGTKYEKQKAVEDAAKLILDPSQYDDANSGHLFYEALESLKALNPDSAEGFLADLIENGNEPWVQSLAAENLGEIGGQNSIAPLLTALASDNGLVQSAAVQGLAKIGDMQGLNQLLNTINQGDPGLQQQILNALARTDNPNSQLALSQALASPQLIEGVAPQDTNH